MSPRTQAQVDAATRAFFEALTVPQVGEVPVITYDGLPGHVRLTYVTGMAAALAAADAVAAGETSPARRPWTPDRQGDDCRLVVTVKRACDGCGELIGDVSDAEVDAAVEGRRMPSVVDEHGCRS